MAELQRRTFLKGLFLTAATGTLAAKDVSLSLITPAQALAHDTAKVEIFWYDPYGTPNGASVARVVLNDTNDRSGFFRGFVRDHLDYLNQVALEPNDAFLRERTLQVFRQSLHEAVMRRRLYDTKVVMNESNHTPAMIERGAKNVDVWIKPIHPLGFYQMRFGFDPEVNYGYAS